jgi:hypothetical protein
MMRPSKVRYTSPMSQNHPENSPTAAEEVKSEFVSDLLRDF